MKLAILSRNPKCYSTARLREAAIARGHSARVLDTLKFSMTVEQEDPGLKYKGRTVGHCDAVIPRIGASVTFYGTAVVRQFEQMGTFTLNSSHSISISRDKLRSLQALTRHSIGMPPTAFVREKGDVLKAIEQVGGVPVIIKLLEGTQGIGVILADSVSIAAAIIETLHSTRQNVLIQKFVAESKGKDVRAFVVGDRVVAAMRRVAQGQEFRSNVHRGGMAQKIDLDPEYEKTAVRAAQIMGLRVAGVDMLEGADGPKIMEVNSSPGLEGIETATGLDIAGEIIGLIEDRVMFPEVDLRQRLTLSAGYSVVEFPVTAESELVGKTIVDTGLRERDVVVLQIDRNGVIIPNPKHTREVMAGDKLLCFGKAITLQSLVPPRSPRKQKRRKVRKLPPADAAQ
ncbi:MAG: 30S ribosomal protein S6--L-glutamate ligase [Phycisphaerales bacterium]|nr:30S ribosomal protein S6--L-glutamate ligase [Phycisphaerales bacterium]MCB9864589.1 30S ribosomal protein S6--L-glutamate ligase [Phycisphaerales bacterium]